MRTASEQFLSEIISSHKAVCRVTLNGTEIEIPVASGAVTMSASSATRSQLDLTVAGNDFVPEGPSSPLAPYGQELLVERGIEYADGTAELVPIGVFRIDEVEIGDLGETRVSGTDRSGWVIDAPFDAPYQIAGSTNVATAIEELITDALPDAALDFISTTNTSTVITVAEGGDRWALALDLARSIGAELFFDGQGHCVLRLVATSQSQGAWSLSDGDGGTLLAATRNWSREGIYNRVVVYGEQLSDNSPARGEAADDDPASPTYYLGAYGQVLLVESDSLIGSNAAAEDAAAGRLANTRTAFASLNFSAITNPILECGDVVNVSHQASKSTGSYRIENLTIPLDPAEPMSGTALSVEQI